MYKINNPSPYINYEDKNENNDKGNLKYHEKTMHLKESKELKEMYPNPNKIQIERFYRRN